MHMYHFATSEPVCFQPQYATTQTLTLGLKTCPALHFEGPASLYWPSRAQQRTSGKIPLGQMCSCISSTGIQAQCLHFRILPSPVVHADSPGPWNVSLWSDCQAPWLCRRCRFPTAGQCSISFTEVSKSESLE